MSKSRQLQDHGQDVDLAKDFKGQTMSFKKHS